MSLLVSFVTGVAGPWAVTTLLGGCGVRIARVSQGQLESEGRYAKPRQLRAGSRGAFPVSLQCRQKGGVVDFIWWDRIQCVGGGPERMERVPGSVGLKAPATLPFPAPLRGSRLPCLGSDQAPPGQAGRCGDGEGLAGEGALCPSYGGWKQVSVSAGEWVRVYGFGGSG